MNQNLVSGIPHSSLQIEKRWPVPFSLQPYPSDPSYEALSIFVLVACALRSTQPVALPHGIELYVEAVESAPTVVLGSLLAHLESALSDESL
jgi:hypothetical protein